MVSRDIGGPGRPDPGMTAGRRSGHTTGGARDVTAAGGNGADANRAEHRESAGRLQTALGQPLVTGLGAGRTRRLMSHLPHKT